MRPTELLPWITVISLGDGILPAMYIKGFVLWSGFRGNWSNSCFCVSKSTAVFRLKARLRRGKIYNNDNNNKNNNNTYLIAGYTGEMYCVCC